MIFKREMLLVGGHRHFAGELVSRLWVGVTLLILIGMIPLCIANAAADKDDTVVKGVVNDESSGEPIPFASISILNTDRGTVANENGEFKIYLHPSDSTIKVSAIGYNSQKHTIPRQPEEIFHIKVSLTPAALELTGIVVYADGLTPAERIIKRAIDRKKEILAAIDNYSFKAYTKTVASYKTEHDTSFLVALITETASDGYWRQPDDYKEIIVARKQGATILAEWNTIAVDRIPNFNRNSIEWGGEKVPTPTAEDALDIYRYWIQDTLYMDSVAIFYLGFEPKKDSSLLSGVIGIANKTYEVREVNISRKRVVSGESEKSDVRYSQRFRRFSGDHWMPVDLHIDGEYPDDSTTWKIEQFTAIQDYEINADLPGGVFDRFRTEVAQGVDDYDSTKWAQRQAIPLSARDSVGYEHTEFLKDSVLSNNPAIRIGFGIYQFNRKLDRFFERYYISSFADWYHFNSVEGNYLGMGFKKSVYETGALGSVSAGYGVSSSRWNYNVSAGYQFDKYHETTLRASFFDKVQPVNYSPGVASRGATFQTLAVQRDPENYVINKGWSAELGYRPFAKWETSVSYTDITQSAISTATDFTLRGSHTFRENPSAQHGNLRKIGVYARFDSRDYQRDGNEISLAFNRNSTLIVLAHERAGDRSIGGDFSYKRYYAELAINRYWALGRGRFSLQLGIVRGLAPSQALFRLGARRGLSGATRQLKTIGSAEFFGDRYALAGMTQVIDINPFRYIPLPIIHSFSSNLGLHGAIGWADFDSRRSEFDQTSFPDASQVYYEAGCGLANFLPIGTLWFSWRLSDFDTDKFHISIDF